MPQFNKLTPNLIVGSVERSLAFYVDVLGFARGLSVPEPLTRFTQLAFGGEPLIVGQVARGGGDERVDVSLRWGCRGLLAWLRRCSAGRRRHRRPGSAGRRRGVAEERRERGVERRTVG